MDKQAVIFIFITNICNLKCLGCMQSCDRKNENPYFVNIEELKEQLLHLQNKVLTINNRNPKSFNLTGGEPLLHPQFFEICRLIRQLFPDFYINVCSNGLLLNKLSDNKLIELAQLNIKFQISYYPDLKLLNYYDIINILSKIDKIKTDENLSDIEIQNILNEANSIKKQFDNYHRT